MSIIAGAAIAGGASLLGGLVSSGSSRKSQKRSLEANKELQEREWQNNLEQWQRENEYNSPAAQMQRLSEAGLNPNLVYGNGSVSGNTTTAGPRYDAPTANLSYDTSGIQKGFSNSIHAFQDYQVRGAQFNNLQAQADLIEAQADNTRAQTLRQEFDLGLESDLREYTTLQRSNKALQSQPELGIAQSSYQIKSVEERVAKDTYHDVISRVKVDLRNAEKSGRNLDSDYFIKLEQAVKVKLENELLRLGIGSNDNVLTRIAGRIINNIIGGTSTGF